LGFRRLQLNQVNTCPTTLQLVCSIKGMFMCYQEQAKLIKLLQGPLLIATLLFLLMLIMPQDNMHQAPRTTECRKTSQNDQFNLSGCPSSFKSAYIYRASDYNLLWCKVPKAGSTSWIENFLTLADVDPEALDQDMKHKSIRAYYPELINLDKMKELSSNSISFMIVRHPLERFLASYIDKQDNWVFELGSWPEFVENMLQIPVHNWNEHWAPIHTLCPPCIRYDIVARMETFEKDSAYIINRAGLSHLLHVPWSNKKSPGSCCCLQAGL